MPKRVLRRPQLRHAVCYPRRHPALSAPGFIQKHCLTHHWPKCSLYAAISPGDATLPLHHLRSLSQCPSRLSRHSSLSRLSAIPQFPAHPLAHPLARPVADTPPLACHAKRNRRIPRPVLLLLLSNHSQTMPPSASPGHSPTKAPSNPSTMLRTTTRRPQPTPTLPSAQM